MTIIKCYYDIEIQRKFFKITPEGRDAINKTIVDVYGKPIENLEFETHANAKHLWRDLVKFVRTNVRRFGEDDMGAKPEGMDPTIYWVNRYPLEKRRLN